MRALVYTDFDTLASDDRLPAPEIAADELLVRVAACGICGSELESFRHRSPRRKPPLVLGHEFCGVVERAGSAADGFRAGDRIVSNSLVSCGQCPRCARGDGHLCERRQLFGMHRPGAFAEYVAVPASAAIPWPASLPAAAACLAEPLANGVHMVRLTAGLAPRHVLVIGGGPIGLLAQQALQALTPARVVVSDIVPERLEIAARTGALRTIRADQEDVVAVVRSLTGGEGADVVIDAVGSELTKRQSLQAVRPGGAVVWIGLAQDEIRLPSFGITIPEVCVHGTYGARRADLQTAIDLLASGRVETASWVQTAPLAEGEALFRAMLAARGRDIKGVLLP